MANPEPDDANSIAVPVEWVLYQARGYAFGFYHPASWTVVAEATDQVALTGSYGEQFQLALFQAQCGVGSEDFAQEEVLDCLGSRGNQAAGARLLSQDLVWEQHKLLYTFTYVVASAASQATSRQFMLVTALADGRMAVGLYQAPVLGPKTERDIEAVMASLRPGKIALQRVTPTPQPTPTELAGLEPRITLAPEATMQPAVAPDEWTMSICDGCGITILHPPEWEILQEESDHNLWRTRGSGLVVIGVGASPCKLADADAEQALACLVSARIAQTDPNSEFIPLDEGNEQTVSGTIYWLAYRSSTPEDQRPLAGLVFYRLLEDHRLVTVEYINAAGAPDPAEQAELLLVAQGVRLAEGQRVTPTPSPVPSATPTPYSTPTIEWLEPLMPVFSR
ncbi:MAG: hypothetical protein LLG44_03715 [Chloroflexi bacterium]|nr:hypothetical protein [Chloroflexota bacterium]